MSLPVPPGAMVESPAKLTVAARVVVERMGRIESGVFIL